MTPADPGAPLLAALSLARSGHRAALVVRGQRQARRALLAAERLAAPEIADGGPRSLTLTGGGRLLLFTARRDPADLRSRFGRCLVIDPDAAACADPWQAAAWGVALGGRA